MRQHRLDELTDQYQPVTVSAEAAVLSAEERLELVRAMRRMPDRQRDVLVLRYYLDLTDEQIAGDLGLSINTVRSTRRRGLLSLQRLLKEGA
jgi:RNA polymerase sigma factor (sigma-70 family)